MAFCRRCGDIVVGPRCKCGGSAVAPSVQFSKDVVSDRWSKTYVARDKSPTRQASVQSPSTESHIPVRRFPRPNSTALAQTPLGHRVSSHIQSAVSHRPSSPLKQTSTPENPPSPAADILPDPYTSTLSKAYGSVLQPKESLSTFTCFLCSAPFSPDATIYPDPANLSTTTRFLCKPCFTDNGGSKGDCAACARPVLILSSEGGFVESAGKIWHKRCFQCEGCFKYIGDQPLVDLLGRPSCDACFDDCLKRPVRDSPRRTPVTPDKALRRSNPGGIKGASREGSPAMEELHQRLGIKSRESSPAIEERSQRLLANSRESSPALEEINQRFATVMNMSSLSRTKKSRESMSENIKSPDLCLTLNSDRNRRDHTGDQIIKSNEIVDAIHTRYLRRSIGTSSSSTSPVFPVSRAPFSARSVSSYSQDSNRTIPSTPDLLSDFSDTGTQFSQPSTPSGSPSSERDMYSQVTPNKTPTRSRSIPNMTTPETPHSPCAKCSKPLIRGKSGGRFVTVPEEPSRTLPARNYHVDCFRCVVCGSEFEETTGGQTAFVRCSSGYCHVGCATPERIVIKPDPTVKTSGHILTPSALRDKPPLTAPPSVMSFPRFGSAAACPGCHKSVSPMEKGVVPGPQGSRWHASCLMCGGKSTRRRDNSKPGCGKRLDSAAKSDGEGGVWCRECLLLISPTRGPLMPSHTGNIFSRFQAGGSVLTPQFTGGTTLARQFTGLGSGPLAMQMTGGGLSPTRQLMSRTPSPTKQLGRMFPRPKSVVGVRSTKSVDDRRGMFF